MLKFSFVLAWVMAGLGVADAPISSFLLARSPSKMTFTQ